MIILQSDVWSIQFRNLNCLFKTMELELINLELINLIWNWNLQNGIGPMSGYNRNILAKSIFLFMGKVCHKNDEIIPDFLSEFLVTSFNEHIV